MIAGTGSCQMSTPSILAQAPIMRSIRCAHRKLAHLASAPRRIITNENPYSLGGCIALLVLAALILNFGAALQP